MADARFFMYASKIALRDDFAPAIASTSGRLLARRAFGGKRRLNVSASDRGGSLRRIAVEVDGRKVASNRFDANGGRCAEPFAFTVPCKLSGRGDVLVDTRLLTDGAHRLGLRVDDAAGNATRTAPSRIRVENAGASCIFGASAQVLARFGRRGKRHLTLRYGKTTSVVGRLLDRRGKAISKAQVRVLSRRRGRASFSQAARVRTGKRGRFRVRIGRGASRRIRLAYCAAGGGGYADLTLRVRAAARLRAAPRHLRNGRP